MVMPRAFSSGALSIWSYAVNVAPPASARTFVIAAVSDVFPWSTCPIVPMLQCGFVRSNFAFAISGFSVPRGSGHAGADLVRDRLWDLFVVIEMHGVLRAALAHRTQGVDVAEHVRERHHRGDDARVPPGVHTRDLAAAAVQIADDVAHVLLGSHHLDPHHRLEKLRPGLHDALLEGGPCRDLEGE